MKATVHYLFNGHVKTDAWEGDIIRWRVASGVLHIEAEPDHGSVPERSKTYFHPITVEATA